MFGRLLGKIITAPIRIANIPLKLVDKAVHTMEGGYWDGDITALPLKKTAETIEDAIESAMDD